MIQDNMMIALKGKELSIEYLYIVENFATLKVKVKSGDFMGVSKFCISEEVITSTIEKLTEMHKELKGICEIVDSDSDAYITLEMDKLGHVIVFGQIGGSHEEHFMKFKYATDQTVLKNIIFLFKERL